MNLSIKHYILSIAILVFSSCTQQSNDATAKIISIKKIDIVADSVSNPEGVMGKYIAKYKTEKDKKMNVKIGYTSVDMPLERHSSPLGDFVAFMLWQRANSIVQTDMAITNSGGIRRNLFAGDITVGDVYEILPFDNMAVVLTFQGSEIQNIADAMALKGGEAMYGISFDIVDGKALGVKINGKTLDTNRSYTVVTNDYLAKGNDQIAPMANHTKAQDLNLLLRDIAVEYIIRNASVDNGK